MPSIKTKDQIIREYLKGKITISECRKLLDKLVGEILVKKIDIK
jgi:hypothetical protein